MLVEASLKRLQLEIANSERDKARLQLLLDGLRARRGSGSIGVIPKDLAAIQFAVHSIPRATWEMRALAKDPKLQAQYLAVERASLPRRYGALWQSLGLSPDQIARFSEITMQQTEQVLDIKTTAQLQGLEDTDPAIKTLLNQAQDRANADKLELLGESGFSQMQDYGRVQPIRDFVDSLSGTLALTGATLNAAQANQLAQIMSASNSSYASGGTAESPIVTSFDNQIISHVPANPAIDSDAVISKAQAILSADQFATLQAQIGRNQYAIQVFNTLVQMPGDPVMGFMLGRY